MSKIKVALAGIGNTASALVQSTFQCREKGENTSIGGYKISDIEFVAAFDVNKNKVGKDLSEAIFAKPNITSKFAHMKKIGTIVRQGPVMDGVANHMTSIMNPTSGTSSLEEVSKEIKEADVMLSLLPVGSENATQFYAEAALKAGTAFINTIPVFIASNPKWNSRFKEANLPVLGDDIKGQIGATILHRTLVRLFKLRNVKVVETYQLNVGGNTDFQNMLDQKRLASKRKSKTDAVISVLPYDIGVRIGPSDYVPFLGNTKVAYIYVKGESFAGFPVSIDLKLTVDDKSMFASSALDATRLAKIALDRGESGPIKEISAYYFKHPPIQAENDEVAAQWVKKWLNKK